MLTEETIRALKADAEDSLAMWAEPDGFLVPTEPDPEERHLVRERLKGAIHAYGIALLALMAGDAEARIRVMLDMAAKVEATAPADEHWRGVIYAYGRVLGGPA